jgi:hypothetical protein
MRVVILAHGDKLYTVSENEDIDGTYRVDHISENAVDIVYMPLGTIQSINISNSVSMGAK